MITASLYLHIPFCDSKCGYCAFNSKTNKNHLKTMYMQTLSKYLRHKLNTLKDKILLTSIYIGGGTPSVVESQLYDAIFAEFTPFLESNAEITIEANPNTLSLEWLRHLKSLGANRLSLGVQSFNAEKLLFLERTHNCKNTFIAIDYAQQAGFNNLSIDLIYGTPFCTESQLEKELHIARTLPLNHISAYHLSLDCGSAFYQKYAHDFAQLQHNFEGEFGGFLSIGHFVEAHLKEFAHYEVSNYGKISTHNLNYWQGGNYLGIGAGAVGYLDGVRTTMPSSIEVFLKGFQEEVEKLTKDDLNLEHLLLGFRSCVGVEVKRIPNAHNLQILLQEKLLTQQGNKVFTNDYFLSDAITLFVS